jgi:hypothetical protein
MYPNRISLIMILAFAWTFLTISHVEAADKKPNILLVMANDMGWTDLGSFGSEIETPHLDTLAEEGVQFTDFHTSVRCSPTRSMLLSGTDNHLASLGNMGELLTPEQVGEGVVSRTTLQGQMMDQSALTGVLNTLCDLGYPLISAVYLPCDTKNTNSYMRGVFDGR